MTDPRPVGSLAPDGSVTIEGWRCTTCSLPLTQPALRCPACRSELAETTFSPSGVVFASTVMRVGVPGHEPPYAIGYLVLDDDGPRILVHSDELLVPGAPARVVSVSPLGDLVASS